MVAIPNIIQLGVTNASITLVGDVVNIVWTDRNGVIHSIPVNVQTDGGWPVIVMWALFKGVIS